MHVDSKCSSASPIALVRAMVRHRHLCWQMITRDIQQRYRGSALGMVWTLVTPMLMLAVYTVVFSGVFKAKWTAASSDSTISVALILFSGLMVHTMLSECLSRAPSIILQHSSFVTKVVFPLEILAPMLLGSALFHFCMSVSILLGALWLIQGALPLTVLYLPIVLLPLWLLMLGGAWLLASIGVFLRDIGQVIGLLMTVLLFLSPVFYPVESLPEAWRGVVNLNPLAFAIEQVRAVVLWGHAPAWRGLMWHGMIGLLVLWIGFAWFQRTRKAFADVL